MAGIGLRKPYYAIYNYDSEQDTVTYSNGGLLGKAVEFSTTFEGSNDNILYADDGPAESDRTFAGGEVSITTDDLLEEASAAILGITLKDITVGDSETPVKEMVYDEAMTVPYLGFGVIIPKQVNGVMYYRAVVLPKVMFSVPEDAATTKGESIEWQTPTVTGTIMRSDADTHPWKREITANDEATAVAYIKEQLNIQPTLGALTVKSTEGTDTGDTKITVTPAKTGSNVYKYKTGATVKLPVYDENVTSGWTAWDGAEDITATNGQQIGIVEATSDGKARKGGVTTVVSKEL